MNVFITKASRFLPNQAVGNDDIERYLGMIDGKPSKARGVILSRNGIRHRYYALDDKGRATHTNVEMAATAVKGLLDEGFSVENIDVLACGTASPEQILPSHAVQVHGLLGGLRNTEVVSLAGSCCSGVAALKYTCMSVALDPTKRAVAVASERISPTLQASFFQTESALLSQLESKPMLAFEKEFLRWMLSDGAFALKVEGSKPENDEIALRVDWIELTSFANTTETCMYAGGEKDEQGNLIGFVSSPQEDWLNKSLFAVKQDTRLLGANIVTLGIRFLQELREKHHFGSEDIDWFLPHLSSMFFKEEIMKQLGDFPIPEHKWFTNLQEIGNIASASPFALIEGIMHSGKLRKGQKVLLMVPESARFSYCFCMMTVC